MSKPIAALWNEGFDLDLDMQRDIARAVNQQYENPVTLSEKETSRVSTKYRHGRKVPTEVICRRLDELAKAVTEGKAAINREFTMREPAELDRDADLVFTEAARRLRDLTKGEKS